ncbi:MAG: DUF554 domain-containing protein [Ndongobacter sp.]|nr:DUF554 domain-containing protein [Ndongobacter sp.]
MIYNLINGLAIAFGALLGFLFRKGLSPAMRDTLVLGMGLGTLYIGISSFNAKADSLCVLGILAVGILLGEALHLHEHLQRFGRKMDARIHAENGYSLSNGFIAASILFCAGSMGILGALQAGAGDGATLLAKAVIDGSIALVYSAILGIGVAFSGLSVILYQGVFVLLAHTLAPFLTETVLATLSSVGGIIILAIGMDMILKKNFRLTSFLPAIFLVLLMGVLRLL